MNVLVALILLVAIVALVRVNRLQRRLVEIERELFSAIRHTTDHPAASPRAAPPASSPAAQPAATPRPMAPASPPAAPPPRPTPPRPAPTAGAGGAGRPPLSGTSGAGDREGRLEVAIGTRWFNVAGIITLLFGVAFFLKYAYENAWIGPHGRVAIGILSGIAAVIVGERTRRRGHLVFSQGLTGGGIAALYLSFFFSFRLYHLIEIAPAFALLAFVTACGVAIAVAQDSLAVAVLSFLGGYLTPILLSTGADAAEFLFTYLTVLALGALAVTYFRRWRRLDLLAFLGTYILYAGWFHSHYGRERLTVSLAGLGVFFLIFLIVPYGHALSRRLVAGPADHALALGNAAFTFGYLYRMIHPLSPRALGFVSLALAACYLGLGSLARRRFSEDRRLAASIFGISITFLTLAVPLHLGLHGITLAWAVQGLLLVWLGFRYEAPLTRMAGGIVVGLAVARLFLFHTPLHRDPFRLFLNGSFGTWAFVVAAVFGAAWLYRKHANQLGDEERVVGSGGIAAALLLLLCALNLECWGFLRLWDYSAQGRAGGMMILWSIFPLAVLGLGLALKDLTVRRLSTLLMFPALVPFFYLLSTLDSRQGMLFGTFAFWMGGLGIASFFTAAAINRRMEGLTLGDVPVDRVLSAIGTLLLFLLLTVEVYTFFRFQPGQPEVMAQNSLRALLAVSVLWAIFATALMAVGFKRSDRGTRYAAAGLFALTLLKAFLMDVWELREIYRIISFVVLGLLLVAASYVYSRLRSRIAGPAVVVLLALFSPGEARADFEASGWKHVRAIDTSAVDQYGEPFAWIILDAEILDGARIDLADLRIVGRGMVEVPYVIHRRSGGSEEALTSPRLLNRARLPRSGATSVELDFGDRVTKNLLEVKTPGEDFRRRVRVEGSDDGRDWREIVERASIYSIPATGSFNGARYERVALPDNDQRRLRVTVYPMPGETDPLQLLEVRAWRRRATPPETERLEIKAFRVSHDRKRDTTLIDIDFGHRHTRPAWVRFDFKQDAFRRSYRLLGRNGVTTTVRRGRTETGDPIMRTVEAPWRQVGSGSFFRLPEGRSGEKAIDETRIEISGAAVRYLRVEVQDHDDRPLDLREIEAHLHVQRVVFPLRPRGLYSLYWGNPEASRPRYDLSAVLPDLADRPPLAAGLGPAGDNPLYGGRPDRPFTERYPWILWIVLLVALSILAMVVVRNLRGLSVKGA
jgi:uncharacterized membrane protein